MKYIFLCLFFLLIQDGISQDGKFNFGARSKGLGGASVALTDEYSLFNNVGGMGWVSNLSVFTGFQNRFGIKEFRTVGLGGIYPFSFGSMGIGFYRFGDRWFNQQRLHLAFGKKFQEVGIGIGVDWLQYDIATVSTTQTLSIQFGGMVRLIPKLILGVHIFNINQSKIGRAEKYSLPTIIKTGISYKPTDELMINAELEKDLGFKEIIRFGIEYRIIERLFFRTGISTTPQIFAIGVGFRPIYFKLDYTFSSATALGAIHEFSLAYLIEEK